MFLVNSLQFRIPQKPYLIKPHKHPPEEVILDHLGDVHKIITFLTPGNSRKDLKKLRDSSAADIIVHLESVRSSVTHQNQSPIRIL